MAGAPDWYPDWRQDAFDRFAEKQDLLTDRFRLGSWPRYNYDLQAGQLTFSDVDGVKVKGDIQTVGTVGPSNWLWAWANAHLPDQQVEDVAKVRAFGVEHGIEELTAEYLEGEDLNALGWELTAIAVKILDAPGGYRAPNGLFLVCRSIGFVS